MSKLLGFSDLKEGVQYRMLHGGERDHGYDYELRDGSLYNISRGRTSSVPFNLKTKFSAIETPYTFKVDSLEFPVECFSDKIVVGCQTLSIDDVYEVFRFVKRYYERG